MGRKTTQDSVAEIYGGSSADIDEMTALRARIDEVHAESCAQDGSDGVLEATCKFFDVSRLLVEQGIFKTRHRSADPADQARLISIVQANVAYLQATVRTLSDKRPQA